MGKSTLRKMRIRISQFLWFFMTCALLLLFRTQLGRAAPGKVDSISGSQQDPGYIDEVIRHSKAAEVSNFMDENIDPCDNFYKFACGNWARINPASTYLNLLSTNLFERLNDGFDRKVKRTLASENVTLDTAEDTQMKNFYQSCMSVHEVGYSYQQSMKDLIAEFGSMPALVGDAWQESDFDWLETTARLAYRYGIITILGIEVTKDIANNKANVVYITPPEFTLRTRTMYLNESTAVYRNNYRILIARKLMTFLGLKQQLALETAAELINFEVQLAHGLENDGDGKDITEIAKLTTVAEMQLAYAPDLNVERLVNVSMGEQIKDNVYDYNTLFKQNLIKVLQHTPKRNLANYIFYRLIDKFAIEPSRSLDTRQEKCTSLTKEYFTKNVDNMIFRHYNNNDTASDMELIWRQMKATFKQTLESNQSLNWISNRTREKAIEKLAAMNLVINSYVNENLTEDFAGLQMHREDYFENLRQIAMLTARLNREKLHAAFKPANMGKQLSYSPVNILIENKIRLPVSLLQPYYLWAASYPNAIKFGTLASFIGHELIHGFDDRGRKVDGRGNANEWWDLQSTKNFVQRQRCFSNQYSQYTSHGIRLPWTIAQSENIADNGGVRLAYAAYRNWQDAQEATVEGRRQLLKEKLPNLNYTNLQLFFISYAQIWCNDVSSGYHNYQIATDNHMPGELRVIGPLSNFDEFAKEFQCRVGTPMNPRKKCKIY